MDVAVRHVTVMMNVGERRAAKGHGKQEAGQNTRHMVLQWAARRGFAEPARVRL